MKHLLLLSRLYNTPLAIDQGKLDILHTNIGIRLLENSPIPSLDTPAKAKQYSFPNSKIAVIDIFGTLLSKGTVGDSGSTNYGYISSRIQEAINSQAKTLIFNIDSPGGEVGGAFSLAYFIKSLPQKYGVSTIAVAEGNANSAAYLLGSAAQKFYATKESLVGSIGVIAMLVDMTKADEQNGMKFEVIRSKDEKGLINPHEPISDAIKNDMASKVMSLDRLFNETISMNRGISVANIMDTKGKSFMAEEALSIGLIDGIISSIEELTLTKVTKMSDSTSNNLDAQYMALQKEKISLETNMASKIEAARIEEQARILAILEASNTFGLPMASTITVIKANYSKEQALTMFEMVKQTAQLANPTPNASNNQGFLGFGANNPNQPTDTNGSVFANIVAGLDSLNKGN